MVDIINLAEKYGKPLCNLVKVVGPFIISQSQISSDKYKSFKLNKAKLVGLSVFINAEAENLARERSKIRERMFELSGVDRVRAQNDLDMLTREVSRLTTISQISDFIDDIKVDEVESHKDIDETWGDRFNFLASSLNEEWRKTLLAKAFALELKNPGSINIVVLNAIAAFDEISFRMFGVVTSSAIRLYEIHCLPCGEFLNHTTFNINGEVYTLNFILYKLSHLNLFDSRTGAFFWVKYGRKTYLRYGRNLIVMENKNENKTVSIDALMMTDLGNKMSLLYNKELTDNGRLFFGMFKDRARQLGVFSEEKSLSDFDYQELGD